ncbi:MAG: hypothetical protein LC099_06390 [Anaerolineales bacterium]|nr:hypothetical protein [Anaerolineales bacterium]
MNRGRIQLALGVVLILIGGGFLLNQTMPAFRDFFAPYIKFPGSLFLVGAAIFIFGLVVGTPSFAIPAAIVAGIGGILYYQQATNRYDTWSYMWTLIPGFIGLGIAVQGLLGESAAYNLKRGLNLMVVSAVLFLVFAAIFGGLNLLGEFAPAIVLILLGVWVLGSGIYRSYSKRRAQE